MGLLSKDYQNFGCSQEFYRALGNNTPTINTTNAYQEGGGAILRRQQGVTSQIINREHNEEEKEGISRNHLIGSDPFGYNNEVAMSSNQM